MIGEAPSFLAALLDGVSWVLSFQPVARDIYSVRLQNARLFVEKRRNVFNFHLLDKRLDLPDSKEVLASITTNSNHDGSGNAVVDIGTGNHVGGSAGDWTVQSKYERVQDQLHARDIAADGNTNGSIISMGTDVRKKVLPSESDGTSTSTTPMNGTAMKGNDTRDNSATNSSVAEIKANEIVKQMLGAVSNLGRPMNEGGTEEVLNVLTN